MTGTNRRKSTEVDEELGDFAKDEPSDSLLLFAAECQVLTLYDQLADLRLEKALLEAQLSLRSADNSQVCENIDEQIKIAETDCLDARAAFLLRDRIMESILIAHPVLKAIHSGDRGKPAERLLHPSIDRRDVLGMADINLSTILNSRLKAFTFLEAQNIRLIEKNRELSSSMVEITDQIREQQSNAINSSDLGDRLKTLQSETKLAKKRWRIMKSLVAGTVVGSGINWANDETLKTLVIDEE